MKRPTDVSEHRGKFKKTWQAKLRFIRKFLVETGIKAGFEVLSGKDRKIVHYKDLVPCDFTLPPLKNFIDIETYSSTRFPDPNKARQKITCVTVWDDVVKTYISFLLDDREGREKLAEDHILFRVKAEGKILLLLKKYYEKVKPDLGAEWNTFDFEYLSVRGERLGVDMTFLETFCQFNLLEGYAKLYKKGSNRLKDVALDEGIIDYVEPEVNYAEMWENDRTGLAKRNKHHVEWMVELNKKKAGGNLVGYYWNLKNHAGVEDLKETLWEGILVDTLLLREYHGEYVLPSKVKHEKTEDLTGGLVGTPPIGIFERVAIFDMSRYYQNIMISKNITPEKTDRLGGAPRVCMKLLEEREKYEKILAKTVIDSEEYKSIKSVRDSVKYLGESVIGYFGSPRCRLFNPRVFNAVTETAQEGLLVLEETAKKLGFRVLYYDTDGIYVEMGEGDTGKLASELTDSMAKWCKKEGMSQSLKLKLDRVFGKVLFKGVKKRVAGHVIWEDGKECDYLYIQGFEYVRRDSSLLTRKVQRETFEQILRGNPEDLVKYLRDVVKKMKAGEYSLREIALKKTLHKKFEDYKSEVDYLRGAKYANKYLGADIRAGDTVYMLYVNRIQGKPSTDVICFMDIPNEKIEINYSKMIERTIKGKVEDLLELVGVSWERVMGARKLTEVF